MATAKDAENAVLRAELDAERELRRRLERRLGMDSTDSGTPSSKERIGAKAAAMPVPQPTSSTSSPGLPATIHATKAPG